MIFTRPALPTQRREDEKTHNPENYIPHASDAQKKALGEIFDLRDQASRVRDIEMALEYDTICQLYTQHVLGTKEYRARFLSAA